MSDIESSSASSIDSTSMDSSSIDSTSMDSSVTSEGSYAFIGLGSLGFHLASRLILGGFELYVNDLSEDLFSRLQSHIDALLSSKAARSHHARLSNLHWSGSASEAVSFSDALITCLPSPSASSAVIREVMVSGELPRPRSGSSVKREFLWIEMSTNDPVALRELSSFALKRGVSTLAVPVTGGVHRAAAGEITLLVGGERRHWESHRVAFDAMGGEQVYVGTIEQAAELKAITNMLAFIHLSAAGEALALAQSSGIDLERAFRAIKHSSGNSFVFETEGQVILNGSYQIDFTMDLACKDMGFVLAQASRHGIPLALASLVSGQFAEARAKYGGAAQSSGLVRLLEDRLGREFRAKGFPTTLPPS